MVFRAILLGLILMAGPLMAGQGGSVLTVRGTGVVRVRPDMATVSVGVDVRAPTAAKALHQNTLRMSAVMALLDQKGIAKADIQTRQFSLNPIWDNKGRAYDKPLDIVGFSVSNVVQVRVRALALLGPILDALTKSGANRIQSVQFGITNPTPFLDQARALAVKEAIRKAGLFAAAAGRRVGDIVTLTESGADMRPPLALETRALAEAVPVAEGELTLQASVTLRVGLR